jgi:phosphopantothenoylcysteine decarboxylase/phosphopantothenate--cysteine ligase
LFIKAGAHVRVIMTPAAKDFITPLTLSTLSKNPVISSFTDDTDDNAVWNNHVELGLWADLFVVAPVTANTLSKMASGNSDNFLVATYLSAKCPVYFAPAMDLDMHKHPTTKTSIETLKSIGNNLIPATSGELASGLVGEGRMAEPEAILEHIELHVLEQLPLYGKRVLVTAGPTYEAIDPVRFIGNHSSGLMGFEIANSAAHLGAEVVLITGPTHFKAENSRIKMVPVMSADEMYTQVHAYFDAVDVAIASAAVADYKPKNAASSKIKKSASTLSLELEKTKDILASIGALKSHQLLVGFALETNDEVANSIKKLKSKNLDLIVLNSLNDKGAGFGGKSNKVTLIDKNLVQTEFPLKSKADVAKDIMNELLKQINA